MTTDLRTARISRDLSMEAVARATGLSVRTIYRAEMGEPTREETLRRIADALGLRLLIRFVDASTGDGECACAIAHPPAGGDAVLQDDQS